MGDHQFGSFTQGIIDLLINTTGEFVTERYITTIYQKPKQYKYIHHTITRFASITLKRIFYRCFPITQRAGCLIVQNYNRLGRARPRLAVRVQSTLWRLGCGCAKKVKTVLQIRQKGHIVQKISRNTF